MAGRCLTAMLLLLCLLPLVSPADEPSPLRVAVFDDEGTSSRVGTLLEVLAQSKDLQVERINAEAIRLGELSRFQVLIHPGGSGSKQGKALGEEGREQVRKFVRNGGGYIGICAGAYLATCDYEWSLNLLDAKVIDKKHWARGYGDVELALTGRSRDMLGATEKHRTIYYHQGPLLAPAENPDIPDYECLARFETEIARNGAPSGVMRQTTAIAASHFGSGRVLCFSPHPERTAEWHAVLHRGITWAATPRTAQR